MSVILMNIQHLQRWFCLFVENKIVHCSNVSVLYIFVERPSECKITVIQFWFHLISGLSSIILESNWVALEMSTGLVSIIFRFERFNQLRKYLFYELYCAIIDTYPGATWFFPCWQAQLSNDLSRSTTMSCLWNGKTFPGGIFLEGSLI